MSQAMWRWAALQYGWNLEPDGPDDVGVVTLSGSRDGVPIRIARDAKFNLSTTAFIEPPLGVAFAITHQGIGGALANLLGFHDVRVGDDAFDREFKIASADPDGLRRFLTAEVKTALFALAEQARGGQVPSRPIANPFSVREFQVTDSAAVMNGAVRVMGTTVDDIVADIAPVVAVVSALTAAARRS